MSHAINLPATFDFAFRPVLAAPAWANALLKTASKVYAIATTSQEVIVMRLTALAVNGNTAHNRKEVERMFTEKMSAVNEASLVLLQHAATMAQAVPTTFFDPKAAEKMLNQAAQAGDKALKPFHSRVTANQKRLSA
jgi:hypothetical protein